MVFDKRRMDRVQAERLAQVDILRIVLAVCMVTQPIVRCFRLCNPSGKVPVVEKVVLNLAWVVRHAQPVHRAMIRKSISSMVEIDRLESLSRRMVKLSGYSPKIPWSRLN